jgi:NADH-quinone oxidoreductase subunit H
LRIDQVMTTCLKYCVPLAAICFIGAIGWQLSGWPTGDRILPLHREGMAAERETWLSNQIQAEKRQAEAEAARADEKSAAQGRRTSEPSLALHAQGAAP